MSLTGLGSIYNKGFLDKVTNCCGLGSIPASESLSLLHFHRDLHRHTRFCDRHRRGNRFAQVSRSRIIEEAQFDCDCIDHGIRLGNLALSGHLVRDYHRASPAWFYVPLLTIMLPFLTFVWASLRLKWNSIWPCVFLHASPRPFIQQSFGPLTVYRNKTGYVASEFRATLLLISVTIALFFRGDATRWKMTIARRPLARTRLLVSTRGVVPSTQLTAGDR